MATAPYQRKEALTLLERLSEPPRFLIIVAGPRQVGKTTLVRNALAQFDPSRYNFVPVDKPDEIQPLRRASVESVIYDQDAGPRNTAWLVSKWQQARAAARELRDSLTRPSCRGCWPFALAPRSRMILNGLKH